MADEFNPAEFQQYKSTVEPPETPTFDPNEFAASKPPPEGEKFEGVMPALGHGIMNAPGAMWQSLKGSGQAINAELNPLSEQRQKSSVLENVLNTGKGLLHAFETPFAAVGSGVAEAFGPAYGEAVHKVGTLIAPETAAKDKPEQLHQMGREAIGTSLQGIRAAGDVVPMPTRPAIAPPVRPYEIPDTQTSPLAPTERPLIFQPKEAPPKPPEITHKQVLADAASKMENINNYGIEFHPEATEALANSIKGKLKAGYKSEARNDIVYKHLDQLLSKDGENPTIQTIWDTRKFLEGDVPGDQKGAARIAIKEIDKYLSNIPPKDAAVNAHNVGIAGPELRESIRDYAIGKQGETLAKQMEDARIGETQGSKSQEDIMRGKIRTALRQGKIYPADVELATKFAEGKLPGGSSIAQLPKRIIDAVGGKGLKFVPGGPLLEGAGKKVSDVASARTLEALRRQTLMRSSLYQKALAAQKAGTAPPSPGGTMAIQARPKKPPIGQPQQLTSSEEEPPEAHAAGGSVKLSHKAVSYSKGHGVQFCRTCKFSDHKPGPTCDWVVDIKPDGWCTLWKR